LFVAQNLFNLLTYFMAQNLANTRFTPQRTYCFGYGAFWGGSGSVGPLGPVFPERVSRSTRARFKLRTS